MVAMAVLCGTRIWYIRLLVHPVGRYVAGGGTREGEELSGHCSHRVVDLPKSTCVTS
jgi:hypothetical protein